VTMQDVGSFCLHMELCLFDHLLADVSVWVFDLVFVGPVLQIWTRSLMRGFSRWRVLVWDPVWSTWNFAVSHLIFSVLLVGFRWLLSFPPFLRRSCC